ncbi:MAG: hypothetical protein D6729_03625 [Deltaproteobacteria bacterium]|nr:MAG: hypothetical protein D6729_03625 [Deltaproteobacteria bacterium]
MKGPAPRNTFHFDPEAPMEGQPVALKAGPITFRNGCEGIESVAVHVNGRRIEVTWTPKAVPPDRICTMALHDDWVEAQLEGLSAGTYTVAVNEVGEATLTVAPRAEGEAE